TLTPSNTLYTAAPVLCHSLCYSLGLGRGRGRVRHQRCAEILVPEVTSAQSGRVPGASNLALLDQIDRVGHREGTIHILFDDKQGDPAFREGVESLEDDVDHDGRQTDGDLVDHDH